MWGQGLALQTVPRNARGIFVPDPGHVFLGFDLAQAEARVVAVLTRDFDLLEHMNSGTDIHCLLGSQIPQFGMSYEELMAKKKEEGGDFRERYLSKKLRHSINYVASPNSIKASINRDYLDTGVGVSLAECRGLHERALEIHPGLPRWWHDVKRKCYSNMGELVNPFGRRRNFAHAGRITDHLHREAVSFYPQSTIADLTTQIIARFDRALDGRGVVLAHMHDGMFAQIPEGFAEEALELLKEAAHIPFNVEGTELLIPVDYKISAESWGALG
jgi:DNA polymerase I-like protein with 3'-5' exonuclease and polymerase domains